MICADEIPTETAGLRDPPDTAPIAYPPAVTQEAMARPNMSLDGSLTVATQRTTKQRTKVKTISAMAAPANVKPDPGAKGKVEPWCMAAYMYAAQMPPRICTPA